MLINDIFLSVKLHAAVIVLSDYPVQPPMFTLAVSSNNGPYIKDDYVRVSFACFCYTKIH